MPSWAAGTISTHPGSPNSNTHGWRRRVLVKREGDREPVLRETGGSSVSQQINPTTLAESFPPPSQGGASWADTALSVAPGGQVFACF